ncbi:hypothetical protein [Bradyrhizobium sp. LHD-71]|uniref:hypothetical protein n=1 Tax=Bradyrhizobium sp. LHD-71 TaxID=3072141 RepID=UPI00280EB4BB|nr:hypothetical protein [Bradyrhizobium sp. LHD-71]MDQ8730662.1 hypothetical protein [Bradyrhizobium sp. LHD-71]
MSRRVTAGRPARRRGAAWLVLVLFGLVAAIAPLRAQTSPAPAPEQPPATSFAPQSPSTPSSAPPASSRPGLIDKLGEWFRDSADGVSSGLKGTQQRIFDINKGALDTLTGIPTAGFAMGRSLCPRAANGAPDCYAASEKLCKERGYTAGRSLDTESAETCNPRIYMPGYQRKEGDCRIDTFVTRAACQ